MAQEIGPDKKFCHKCGDVIFRDAVICPKCGVPQGSSYPSGKNKVTAGLFAILLGGLGVHKFYLGKTGMGLLYLLFCWTLIPAIAGLIEGILYLTSSDTDFERKYAAK